MDELDNAPGFEDRLPVYDDSFNSLISDVESETGAKIECMCFNCGHDDTHVQLNGLNERLMREAFEEHQDKDSADDFARASLKNMFMRCYLSEGLKRGLLERLYKVQIRANKNVSVEKLFAIKRMLEIGLGMDFPKRLTDARKFYGESAPNVGQKAIDDIDKWKQTAHLESILAHRQILDGEISVDGDLVILTFERKVDFWPAYECVCEPDGTRGLYWGWLSIGKDAYLIPAADVRSYFLFHEDEDKQGRCFWTPLLGVCGIQTKKGTMVWIDSKEAFVHLIDVRMLNRFGVVNLGYSVTEGLGLLADYIRVFRYGRKVREDFERTNKSFRLSLPRGVLIRARNRDDEYFHDWTDSEMADEGLRESGPCGNWPDYE